MTRFEGFPTAGLAFLRDLARNNDRAWFVERKNIYHDRVEEPMHALISDVAAGCAAATLASHQTRVSRRATRSRRKSGAASAPCHLDSLSRWQHCNETFPHKGRNVGSAVNRRSCRAGGFNRPRYRKAPGRSLHTISCLRDRASRT